MKKNNQQNDRVKSKVNSTFRTKFKKVICSSKLYSMQELAELFKDDIDINKATHKEIKNLSDLLYEFNNKECYASLNQNNYGLLLNHFKVLDFWENILNTGSTSEKMEALRRIDDLVEDDGRRHVVLGALTHNTNEELRKLARAKYMKFNANDAYKFLDESIDKDLTKLDLLRLHHYLKEKNENGKLPELVNWVRKNKNNVFRAFLIKEIGYFNQKGSEGYLLKLFYDEETSENMKLAIVKALADLKHKPAIKDLKKQFKITSTKVQLSIIDLIANVNYDENRDYLIKIYKKTYNQEIKSHIFSIFYQLDHEALSIIEKAENQQKTYQQKYVA